MESDHVSLPASLVVTGQPTCFTNLAVNLLDVKAVNEYGTAKLVHESDIQQGIITDTETDHETPLHDMFS